MADALGSFFGFGGGGKQYQRIDRITDQTAKEAAPRPIVWGRVRPIAGNLIHLSEARYEMIKVDEIEMGKDDVDVYQENVFRTYAIRICEGPVTGVVRVWKNDELVYDARGNEWGDKNNGKFLKNAVFYLGEWDQLPDPELESLWGVGNVPAYRGTCYLRIYDENLTDTGGRVPNYIFEVQRDPPYIYATSLPYMASNTSSLEYTDSDASSVIYPIEPVIEDLLASSGIVSGGRFGQTLLEYSTDPEDVLASSGLITGGELRTALHSYIIPTESVDAGSMMIFGGVLRDALHEYTVPSESVSSGSMQIEGGQFDLKLVRYENWEPDSVESGSMQITSGVFE